MKATVRRGKQPRRRRAQATDRAEIQRIVAELQQHVATLTAIFNTLAARQAAGEKGGANG